jgi:hypothetical protein
LFLASGTNGGTNENTNILRTDNFSLALNDSGISHYYYHGDEPHDKILLYNSVNLTFNMFSHHIAGTLNQFYDDPWTLKTIQTTSSTTSSAWMIYVPFIGLFTLRVRGKDRQKNKPRII